MNARRRRRRRRRMDPITAFGMIVVIAVVIFAITTLFRGIAANHKAERDIAAMDEWYENYQKKQEEHEAIMARLQLDKEREFYATHNTDQTSQLAYVYQD